jgi:hypothetical protein
MSGFVEGRHAVASSRMRRQMGCALAAVFAAHVLLLSTWHWRSGTVGAGATPVRTLLVRWVHEATAVAAVESRVEAPKKHSVAQADAMSTRHAPSNAALRTSEAPQIAAAGSSSDAGLPVYPEALTVRVPAQAIGSGPAHATLTVSLDERGRAREVKGADRDLPPAFLEATRVLLAETRFDQLPLEGEVGQSVTRFKIQADFVAENLGTH